MASTTRADIWTSSVRLYKSRSVAAAACRAGHVRINGSKVKPSHAVSIGDRIEALTDAGPRIAIVKKIIIKRVGASVAVECFDDLTPAAPPPEETPMMPRRDRGAGRPTKRDRRLLDRLRER